MQSVVAWKAITRAAGAPPPLGARGAVFSERRYLLALTVAPTGSLNPLSVSMGLLPAGYFQTPTLPASKIAAWMLRLN